jgi:hypothetical protein
VSLATLLGASAYASGGTDVGFFIGIKDANFSTTANPNSSNPSFTSGVGIAAGVIATGDMSLPVQFRTGAYYSERAASVSATNSGGSNVTANIKFSYIDIPLTVLYRFGDMFGVFGGAVVGLKVAANCSGDGTICNANYASSTDGGVLAGQLGVNVKFHPNWSAEAMYDIGLTPVSTDTTASAIGASIIFTY